MKKEMEEYNEEKCTRKKESMKERKNEKRKKNGKDRKRNIHVREIK